MSLMFSSRKSANFYQTNAPNEKFLWYLWVKRDNVPSLCFYTNHGWKNFYSDSYNDRGIFGGGKWGSDHKNTIDYITISSPGNATDFGDLSFSDICSGTSNGVYETGLFSVTSQIDHMTICTLGNSSSFGSLSVSRDYHSACNNIF